MNFFNHSQINLFQRTHLKNQQISVSMGSLFLLWNTCEDVNSCVIITDLVKVEWKGVENILVQRKYLLKNKLEPLKGIFEKRFMDKSKDRMTKNTLKLLI